MMKRKTFAVLVVLSLSCCGVSGNLYLSTTTTTTSTPLPSSLLDEEEYVEPSGDSELIMVRPNDTLLVNKLPSYFPTNSVGDGISGTTGRSSSSSSSSNESSSESTESYGNDDLSSSNNFTTSFTPTSYEGTSNISRERELLNDNPLSDPLSIAIPMTIIYSLILLSGLVGNVSTCVVIARTSYMHTATNYYLFSLAMSDLLLLLSGLPQEIYHIWVRYPYVFGAAFCVIRGVAAETSANATVLTITAFTVERFVAIVHPLKSHKLSQLSRVVKMIGIIWIVAFCLALPQAAQFGVEDIVSKHNHKIILVKGAYCTLSREQIFPYAFQISICVFFAIPMTVITVLYVLIGVKLRRSRKGPIAHGSQELTVEPRTQNRHSQTHVIRMLVAVVVAFFICWAPHHAQRLMALYGQSQTTSTSTGKLSPLFMTVYGGLMHVSGILYYISTCINPILYHIMSNKFRQAFKDTMSGICGGRANSRLQNRTYSAMSHRSSRVLHHYSSKRNYHPNGGPGGGGGGGGGGGSNVGGGTLGAGRNQREILATVAENSSGSQGDGGNILPPSSNVVNPCSCKSGLQNQPGMNTPGKAGGGGASNSLPTSGKSSSTTNMNIPNKKNHSGLTLKSKYLNMHKNNNERNTGWKKNNLSPNTPPTPDFDDDDEDTMSTFASSSPKDINGIMIPLNELKDKSKEPLDQQSKSGGLKKSISSSKYPSNRGGGLRAFLFRRKEKNKSSPGNKTGILLGSQGVKGPVSRPFRPPSDPGINSTYAVTILDSKGKSKTVPTSVGIARQRTGSSGNCLVGIHKATSRATSHTSVDSNNTNTISNSSLQDMDESEYTGQELAGFMAELNNSNNSRDGRNSHKSNGAL